MSNADVRQAIADAVSTVSGLTGYAQRPPSAREGDAWPQWRGGERAAGREFLQTWAVMLLLPQSQEVLADEWADRYGPDLVDALQGADALFVTRIDPATVRLETGDAYALMITGVRE